MCVCEGCAASHESIYVRCLGLRMTAEVPDPIIEVIDRDEENIRLVSRVHIQAKEPQKSREEMSPFHVRLRTRGPILSCIPFVSGAQRGGKEGDLLCWVHLPEAGRACEMTAKES